MKRRRVAVIDCETDPFRRGRIPQPFVWGWYDGVEFRSWEHEHVEAFVDFIAEHDMVVYAHNGGKFDYEWLKPYANLGEVMIINGRLAKFSIGRAEMRDSFNIIPAALAKYQKTDIDYALMERSRRYKTDNWREILAYLRDDCVNLYELVQAFIAAYGLQLTQAGASMRQWKKISGEPVEASTPEFFDDLHPWYYGGRVDVFRPGITRSRFRVYDINSAYPFAMRHPHPHRFAYERFPGWLAGAQFYRVSARSLGAFPWREDSGKLTFPRDGELREFTVTHWEIAAARDTGTLVEPTWLESIRFVELHDFAAYIDHFYQQRLEARESGDRIGDLFAKLFMNSLYGKFAADPRRYKRYRLVPRHTFFDEDGISADGFEFVADFGHAFLVGQPLPEEHWRFYNVATASSVTGFVRAMLWRAICAVGVPHMLYCDTDSIASTSGAGLELGEQRLGAWKDEGGFVRAGIAGKKLYIFRRERADEKYARDDPLRWHKLASKGVRLTPAQLWRVAQGGEVIFKPTVPTIGPRGPPVFVPRKVVATF